jgi:hypothetical protein
MLCFELWAGVLAPIGPSFNQTRLSVKVFCYKTCHLCKGIGSQLAELLMFYGICERGKRRGHVAPCRAEKRVSS